MRTTSVYAFNLLVHRETCQLYVLARHRCSCVLCSASFDSTVKLWDPATEKERFTLARHTAMVYALAFSPNGQYVASGSGDRAVHVWSARDGSLIRTFTAPSGVFDLSFNRTGDKLAACCANSAVAVVDLRL